MEVQQEDKEKELRERIEEVKVKLERTENMLQNKEKKWSELERIVVTYARKDHDLRKKLTEIKYICDDPSSKRRITTVVEENAELKSKLENMKSEMEELKSHIEYAKSNPTWLYDDEDDYFKITMQFQEDEVRMEKKQLTKKGNLNLSTLTDNKTINPNLNQAFVDKSRIDTSNMIMDDGSILGGLHLNKSNISTNECSKWKWLMFENRRKEEIIKKLELQSKEKQNQFDSFGPEHETDNPNTDPMFNAKEDLVLSGSHVKNPNTFELSKEICELEKSIGRIEHNRSMSDIKYPVCHKRMESIIKVDEVFKS